MRMKNKKLRNTFIAYGFMLPALAILIVFILFPVLFSIPLSLFDYSAIGQTKFIGLENFKKLFQDTRFWIAMKNSVLFILCVPILQFCSLLLAAAVNRKRKGITFFRVLFYIPVVTSMIAISIMWGFLFSGDGVINTALMNWGIIKEPIYFLTSPRLALPSLMFVTIWQGLGYYMMLYLAGLQSVPAELTEAAKIDGAGRSRTFFSITMPMMKPYIWFCCLYSILSALGVFDIVFAMTNGGPDNATLVMNFYTYKKAFGNFEFGYASASGLVMSVITTLFSCLIFLYGKRGGMSNEE